MLNGIQIGDLIELKLWDGNHACGRCIHVYPEYGCIELDMSCDYHAKTRFFNRDEIKEVVK